MRKSNSPLYIATLLIISYIGGVIILGTMWTVIETVTPIKLNLVEIVSIFVNIFLAIFIAQVINKKNEYQRIEKDLLIKQVNDIDDELEYFLHEKVLSLKGGLVPLTSITSMIQSSQMLINTISNTVGEHNLLKDDSSIRQLKRDVTKLRDILTETPKDRKVKKGYPIIKNNKALFDESSKQKIRKSKSTIKQSFFRLIVAINRNS